MRRENSRTTTPSISGSHMSRSSTCISGVFKTAVPLTLVNSMERTIVRPYLFAVHLFTVRWAEMLKRSSNGRISLETRIHSITFFMSSLALNHSASYIRLRSADNEENVKNCSGITLVTIYGSSQHPCFNHLVFARGSKRRKFSCHVTAESTGRQGHTF